MSQSYLYGLEGIYLTFYKRAKFWLDTALCGENLNYRVLSVYVPCIVTFSPYYQY